VTDEDVPDFVVGHIRSLGARDTGAKRRQDALSEKTPMLDDSETEIDHPAIAPADAVTTRAFRYDVFLCHNMADKPFVKLLADALQIEAGILFFLDEFSIPASVEFMGYIREEMRKSAACAIFLGRNGWGIGKCFFTTRHNLFCSQAAVDISLQPIRENGRLVRLRGIADTDG
jgi:hypothetical protein